MVEHPAPWESLATMFGVSGQADAPEAFNRLHVFLAGFGSVGRPLAEELANRGVRDFSIADPKRCRESSVASQAEPGEVGRLKAEVGAQLLRAQGARVRAYPADLYTLPDGVVNGDTVIVCSADNRRADLGASRLAARMRARLVKVNVEPAYGLVSVRCFDYRGAYDRCVECQFTAGHYERQLHPRSCDGGVERSTNSPRWLGRTAGRIGALAVLALARDGEAAERWYGKEWAYRHGSDSVECSELLPNPHCRWEHGTAWPNPVRLADGPDRITLRELLSHDRRDDPAAVRLRFCQQVCLRGRCAVCGHEVRTPRWLVAVEDGMGTCPGCGGRLLAVPFWLYRELPAGELAAVWERPLASWGVAPGAVIEVSGAGGAASYILNPAEPACGFAEGR